MKRSKIIEEKHLQILSIESSSASSFVIEVGNLLINSLCMLPSTAENTVRRTNEGGGGGGETGEIEEREKEKKSLRSKQTLEEEGEGGGIIEQWELAGCV